MVASGLRIDGRAALLVNECQRGLLDPDLTSFAGLADHAASRGIVPRIAELARGFRQAGLPVIHTPAAHRGDFLDAPANTLIAAMARKHRLMVAGSREAEIVPALAPEPEDIVVWRSSGMIAMLGTSVDTILRRLKVEILVLAGVSTNLAIAGCAIAASDFGYTTVVPEDCIAGSDPATHATIVNEQLRMVARIVTADDVLGALPAQVT